MIESISLRSVGVISSAELELGPGFIALTGETGAGKTMVLTALGLLLGERADSTAVRSGEKQLFVEGRLQSSDGNLQQRLSDLGADVSDGEILINRSVSAEGKSRAAVGGAAVPISVLAEISEQLVAVHGQSDQVRLRSGAMQREALDSFAGEKLARIMLAYKPLFSQYQELSARLVRMHAQSQGDLARLDALRGQVSEIQAANLAAGELAELSEHIARLSNVEQLREAASAAHGRLTSEEAEGAVALLAQAKRFLEHSNDPRLEKLAQLASDSAAIASELAMELASYLSELEADPTLLENLMSRKALLVGLERKFGLSIEELIEQLPKYQAEILDLDSSDEQLEKLEMQLAATEAQLAQLARDISETRRAAATEMIAQVTAELASLAMTGSRLEIRISETADFESSGRDRVEFLLAPHQGAEPRPLGKGASGGELSRIMLAIELVLAAGQQLPTMIFDEVDAGVGGAAAVELGRRLRRLSQSTQVIVVTHLPQVAAFADKQIRVSKDQSGEITVSSVQVLAPAERERELARMLSGSAESDVALMHARELLNSAN